MIPQVMLIFAALLVLEQGLKFQSECKIGPKRNYSLRNVATETNRNAHIGCELHHPYRPYIRTHATNLFSYEGLRLSKMY